MLNTFLQALQGFLAASWYFNQSEPSFVVLNLLYALFFLYFSSTLTSYPWLAKSRGSHSTWDMPFWYVDNVFAKFCPQVVIGVSENFIQRT